MAGERLVQREWMLLRRDRAAWVAVCLFFALCVASLWNGRRWMEEQQRAHDRVAAEETAAYADRRTEAAASEMKPPRPIESVLASLSDPSSPFVIGQFGRTVMMPLLPMTAACIGQLDFVSVREGISVRTHLRTVASKDGLENPLNLMTGRFDLAFVIIYFLPLLIIALTYNLVSLEREQGTLALLRSQPIRLARIILIKAVLRLGLLLLACFAATAMALPVLDARLAIWMLVVLAYAVFWASLSLWINAKSGSSVTNATILAGAWLVFTAVVPAALQFAVSTIRPAPSRLQLLAAIRERSIDARRDGKPLAAAWYAEHPELVPASVTGLPFNYPIQGTMTHIEEDRRTLPIIQEFGRGVAAQQELVRTLRFFSPAVLTYEALQDVSGSGIGRVRLFRQQVQEFREAWLTWFHPRIFRMTMLRSSEYSAIPKFSFREEATQDWASRAWPGALALLAVSCILSFTAVKKLG